ncbi:hypothetical protein FRB96_002038 [Tulasnella sp. 330]|nr:hypothetical protein FRB96_002038 [Tulasnella sp. 330]KAG8882904.1 hypothetical protein FRB98_003400 [Tulasnella sp. 332]
MRTFITLSTVTLLGISATQAAPLPQTFSGLTSSSRIKNEGIIAGSVAGGVLLAGGAIGAYKMKRRKGLGASSDRKQDLSPRPESYTFPELGSPASVREKVAKALEAQKIQAKSAEEVEKSEKHVKKARKKKTLGEEADSAKGSNLESDAERLSKEMHRP